MQNYTDEASWFDGLFAQRVFYNFDTIVSKTLNPIDQKWWAHNFGLILNGHTKKLSFIPWDYSLSFKEVPQFVDTGDLVHVQPLGQMNMDGPKPPPWFVTLSAEQRRTWCSGATTYHFTCGPVGYTMALAWKDVYLDYIKKYLVTNLSRSPAYSPLQKANDLVSTWTEEFLPSVTRQAAAGQIPRVKDFTQHASVILQMFASGLTDLYTWSTLQCAQPTSNEGVALDEVSAKAGSLWYGLAYIAGVGSGAFALLAHWTRRRIAPAELDYSQL